MSERPMRYSQAQHPYSVVRHAAGLVFVAGQLGVRDNEIVAGSVVAQTQQALENLREALRGAGCGPADVVKTTLYLVNSADRLVVDPVYLEFFEPPLPARSCIIAAELPFGALVEIEAIAALPAQAGRGA